MEKGQKMTEEQKQQIRKSNKKTYQEKGPYFQAFGADNPATDPVVRKKISNTVKKLWADGKYKERINGMLGKTGVLHPNFSPYSEIKHQTSKYLSHFHDIDVCFDCSAKRKDTKIDVHHIDEDHSNFLITNLEPLCVMCHQKYHIHHRYQPYVTIGKEFMFESCHQLFHHPGKCKRHHGHSYFLVVKIKKRINPDTGMVLDFGILKKIINDTVIEKLDHFNLNDKMDFQTTAENMLFWIWKQLEIEGKLKGLNKILLKETRSSMAEITYKDVLEYEKKLIDKKFLEDKVMRR